MIGNRKYISDELFHLVGFRHPSDDEKNYVILTKILSDGWVSYAPHSKDWGETEIKINWDADFIRGEFIVPTVTCFADIPFECLGLHAKKYGRFGLSIERRTLVYYHARPVIYIPYLPEDRKSISGLGLLTHLRNVFEGFELLVAKDLDGIPIYHGARLKSRGEAIFATSNVFLKEFLAFVKPFDSTLEENDPGNYYLEREWRKFGNLELKHDYVQKIVVVADYVHRLKKDFPEYRGIVCECPQ